MLRFSALAPGGTRHTVINGNSAVVDYSAGCDSMLFDPPFELVADWSFRDFPGGVIMFTDGKNIGRAIDAFGSKNLQHQFIWDCVSSWFTPNRPLKRHKSALWFGVSPHYCADAYFQSRRAQSKRVTNSRGSYDYHSAAGVRVSDVYRLPITELHANSGKPIQSGDLFGGGSEANGIWKSHSKPAEWVRSLIACCLSGCVYDPCAGGGGFVTDCAAVGRDSVHVEVDGDRFMMIFQMLVANGFDCGEIHES